MVKPEYDREHLAAIRALGQTPKQRERELDIEAGLITGPRRDTTALKLIGFVMDMLYGVFINRPYASRRFWTFWAVVFVALAVGVVLD